MTRLSRIVRPSLALSLLLAGACGPAGDSTSASAQALSLTELESLLSGGATRIEIELVPGTLVAREMHAETGDDDEKLVGQIASIDAATGSVTIDVGGLAITYGGATRFRTPDDSNVARTAWETEAVAGTPIEIRRTLPSAAQAPDDASFAADDLRIADAVEEPKLELLIDADNLEVTSANEGVLHVLGLSIAITSSTQLFEDSSSNNSPSSGEYAGAVTAVDGAAGTITLAGGMVVDVSGVSFDPEGDLYSLSSVSDAVAAGAPVRAEGAGTAADGVFVASSLKVEVDD